MGPGKNIPELFSNTDISFPHVEIPRSVHYRLLRYMTMQNTLKGNTLIITRKDLDQRQPVGWMGTYINNVVLINLDRKDLMDDYPDFFDCLYPCTNKKTNWIETLI